MGCYASSMFYYLDCCYKLPGGPRGPRGPRFGRFYKKYPQFEQYAGHFTSLGFTERDLAYLKQVFDHADGDKSGQISLMELLMFLDIDRTKFAKRVFSIFDEDLSGEIDFREFVVAMWNYCTLGKSALCLFAFDLYDSDSSGYIETSEIKHMLKDIYGKKFDKSGLAVRVLGQLTGGGADAMLGIDTEVSVSMFEQFSRTHPALLYPAYSFQHNLQQKVLGPGFWESKAHNRLCLTGNKETNVTEFLKAMMNEGAFHALVLDPFSKKGGEQPTDVELTNLANVMDNAGSVAARRMQKGIAVTTVTAVHAAAKFKGSLKKKRNGGGGRRRSSDQIELKAKRGEDRRGAAVKEAQDKAQARFGGKLSAAEAAEKLAGKGGKGGRDNRFLKDGAREKNAKTGERNSIKLKKARTAISASTAFNGLNKLAHEGKSGGAVGGRSSKVMPVKRGGSNK